MSRYLDECDLERSHELERRLDRDTEREPITAGRARRRPRYFSGSLFRAAVATEAVTTIEMRKAS